MGQNQCKQKKRYNSEGPHDHTSIKTEQENIDTTTEQFNYGLNNQIVIQNIPSYIKKMEKRKNFSTVTDKDTLDSQNQVMPPYKKPKLPPMEKRKKPPIPINNEKLVLQNQEKRQKTQKERNPIKLNLQKKQAIRSTFVIDRQAKTTINTFTLGLQDQILEENKPAYMFSGLSVYLALSMLQEGTSGNCTAELEKKCGISSEKSTRATVLTSLQNTMADLLANESTCKYFLANGLFLKRDDAVKGSYRECLKDSYKAGLGGLNKDFINRWVSDNTNAKITDLVNGIDSSTVSILANVVYFKADWKNPFKKENTHDFPFLQNGDTSTLKNVKMMYMEKNRFGQKQDNSGNEYLKLDYKDCNLSMVFLLPPYSKPLEHSLDTKEKILSVTDWDRSLVEVNVKIPIFEINTDFNVKQMLKAIGVEHIFSDGANKFDEMFDNRSDMCIGEIMQKSYIKVNEVGTEAVAATIIFKGVTCSRLPKLTKKFILDRPFSFYIIDEKGLIYFNGAINSF